MILRRVFIACWSLVSAVAVGQENPSPAWTYDRQLLVPFWEGDVMHGEPILFVKQPNSEAATGELLFPVTKMLSVCNSGGDVTYEEGRDYVWQPGSRTISIPVGSRIATKTDQDLRRPAKSQKYELTHRDGNGEIYFGAKLEYHDMQTCFTYKHEPDKWAAIPPKFDETRLPRTIGKLGGRQPVSIIVVGDSIAAGNNASGHAGQAPYQPPFTGLLEKHLTAAYETNVAVKNLSVSGTDTAWALTMINDIVDANPDVVILAFGMNDAAGRSANDYRDNLVATIAKIREQRPETEFILVASMLGNQDWIRLNHERFPLYREALAELCAPGVVLADLTTQWQSMLKIKQDRDLTGNGVNHPNDFGHRVYAQVISRLLMPY